MKPKKRKLSGKLLGVIQCLSQTYKQKLFFFFAGVFSFCNGCFILSPYQKRWWKKKLHLNLTCLYLLVIFPGDFSSLFFSTYHLSLAHSTVGEGTDALKCNSWWFLLPPFPRIFFKKLMIASFCWKRSHAFQRNENLLFIHCDVM